MDAHVGRQIMEFLLEFLGGSGKTVVMAYHQLHFLHHAVRTLHYYYSRPCACTDTGSGS